MLIEFSLANFGSVLDRQSISFISDGAAELSGNVVKSDSRQLLRSIGIYGPNASGKSTLLRAFDFVQDCVVLSAGYVPGFEIPVKPFRLTELSRNAASEFEVVFVEDSRVYRYGFRCNKQRFVDEWLYERPTATAKERRLFKREYNAASDTYRYHYSEHFEKPTLRGVFEELCSPSNLYLSVGTLRNSAILLPVFNWFKNRLRIILSSESLSQVFSLRKLEDKAWRARIVEFLQCADLNIADVILEKVAFSETHLPDDMRDEIRSAIADQMKGEVALKPIYVHRDKNGLDVRFDRSEESDGTNLLLALAGPLFDVLDNSLVLVIDELDRSLHPLIVHKLLERFHGTRSQAQMLFTTHDTSILARKLLRRDQVCLIDKSAESATQIRRLSDFKVREDAAIEKGYLGGRYGGIPVLSDLIDYEKK